MSYIKLYLDINKFNAVVLTNNVILHSSIVASNYDSIDSYTNS